MARTRNGNHRVKLSASNKHAKDKKKVQQRNACQRYRDKIKSNPKKYEEHKARDRLRKAKEKQVRTVKDLSARDLRKKRAKMRNYMREYRKKNKPVDEELIDSPPDPEPSANPAASVPHPSDVKVSSTQKQRGRKKVRRDKAKLYKSNQNLKKQNTALQRRVWVLEKRLAKKKTEKVDESLLTPRSRLRKLTKGQFVNETVKRQLFTGFVVMEECKQAKDKVSKENKLKVAYHRIFSGKVIKKYRQLNRCKNILPDKCGKRGRKWQENLKSDDNPLNVNFQSPKNVLTKRDEIQKFFLSSDGSSCCPGKKDFVTIKGEKVQKRYLNDTISALYTKFLSTSPIKVSFAMFAFYRPKFIVAPKFSNRDTCLCVHCDNFKLLIKSLKTADIISESNKNGILETVCCVNRTTDCFFRTCENCKLNNVTLNITQETDTISYLKWKTVNVEHPKKTGESMKITRKETVEVSASNLPKLFEDTLVQYLAHVGRVYNQQNGLKYVEENLKPGDLMLQVDWSENFDCKYATEVQSMHFGGSHKQISLHTGFVKSNNVFETFCTVSESLNHSPKGVFAHLRPILERYVNDETENVLIASDGPTSQYRNRHMFVIVAKHVSALIPQVKKITWHFSEAGHGKGIPDGVGGTLKRTADNIVALGSDITDAKTFVSKISEKCQKVFVRLVTTSESEQAEKLVVEGKAFRGTLKVHQYVWKREDPKKITFKSLSCYKCQEDCQHFYLGVLKIP